MGNTHILEALSC